MGTNDEQGTTTATEADAPTVAADATPAAEAARPRTAAATEARRRQAEERRQAAAAAEAAGEPVEPADAAPRRGRRKGSRRAASAAAGAKRAKSMGTAATRKAIAETLRLVGGLAAIADPVDGSIILQNADTLAEAWAPIFDRHPRLKVALSGIEAGGIYGAAIVATASVALPILAHHGKLPPAALQAAGLAGVPVPSPAPDGGGDRPPMFQAFRRPEPAPEPAVEPAASEPAPHPLGGVHAPPRPAA